MPDMNFLGQGFQMLKHYRQTDTQTGATENITTLHSRVESGNQVCHGLKYLVCGTATAALVSKKY